MISSFVYAEVDNDLEEELFEAIEYIDIKWLTELLEEDKVYVNVVDDLGWHYLESPLSFTEHITYITYDS